ncbi:DUF5684 domain-containing protein [Kutzneria sp. CA-103260]|uniref:DUF5684 domain-containing protein n=1 Tax=Kutzneria sp. CA-103260 TaxID=2802641 RepID=UPI001BA6B20C|nr:DUF5684 domain-containing protein [Kutzneria sp. CA-103260]QUQ67389.1 hypothetical protein JJ691_51230 [Kutzneria sp. CA-103260]
MNYDQTASSGLSPAVAIIFGVIYVAFIVFEIAAYWKVFAKAGRPGWGAIIPFYNIYLMIKVAGRPGWWLILYIIPIVNFVIHLIVSLDIARNFGKGSGFGVLGLWLFSFIGFPILGFGSAQYQGPRPAQQY